MKKLSLLLIISITLIFASECLIMVDLTEERLAPFAENDLKVVQELENSAILLVDCADFDKLASHSYEILDSSPEEGRYYLVRALDPASDLSVYGEILWKEGDDYLLKIDVGLLESLMKQRVMLKRMTLKPIIIKNEATPLQFRTDSTVQEIIDLIDPDSILASVQRLQDFVTRYSFTDSCVAAADWIVGRFTDYGCDSVFLHYHTGGQAPNVIAVKHGVVHPDNVYVIICGHFDSTSFIDPWNEAPGADDNASGTTSALEAARVMQNYEFEYSIRFCAWSGEEQGLYGSDAYASYVYSQGDSIIAVLNADMIAYTDILPESIEVIAKISNPACGWLADFFIAAADSYATLLTKKTMTSYWPWSDHSSFWDKNYPAILNIEDDLPLPNPYYHLPGDTIGGGYNNNNFCTETIKAMIATLALLAVPYHPDPGVEEFGDVVSNTPQLRIYPSLGSSRFTISFTNTSDTEATLKIYDVSGKLVRTLLQPSPVEWTGIDDFGKKVPAGIYVVRLEMGELSTAEKLIVLK
ncbi:hypothetical protein AMJ52_07485 [candidate division TA06 bacterium DG_78]|uniref:Uncharacterized protein n=1 Tax=candidate division TA06 bacterium DG_78 TaxID=1703772 RepID=A0A0S7YC52_UNCT6|nr:MAG: hypothetical protein AMJ52_07485 [candidate division TA06 bacterium DG_78]